MTDSMSYGDIVTDFLIRLLGYSLIVCSEQKIISTARDDSSKRFEDLLSSGYSLQKRAKVSYIKLPDELKTFYPEIDGFFHKFAALPTKETWYPIDEIIETPSGAYEKTIHM